MNLPATVSHSQPQLRSFVGKARNVTCRAAAASWSPSFGKSQPSPQEKSAEPAEQLKAAQQPADDAAVSAAAEALPTHRRSQPRYRPSSFHLSVRRMLCFTVAPHRNY